jgi:LysM repeat protein
MRERSEMSKVMLAMVAVLGMAALLSGTALASDGEPSKPVSKVTVTKPAPPKVYVVQSGDNLSSIAQTEQLSSWVPLWDANPSVTDPDLIYSGEQLVVPTGPVTDRALPVGYETPAPSSSEAPTTFVTSSNAYEPVSRPAEYAAGTGGILARVRMRESGGNYADNTGNGYYGAYQFSLSTWESVGGTGLPSNASPAEQDALAQKLYSERGCSPWPNTCY